jgi:hypothetical protein
VKISATALFRPVLQAALGEALEQALDVSRLMRDTPQSTVSERQFHLQWTRATVLGMRKLQGRYNLARAREEDNTVEATKEQFDSLKEDGIALRRFAGGPETHAVFNLFEQAELQQLDYLRHSALAASELERRLDSSIVQTLKSPQAAAADQPVPPLQDVDVQPAEIRPESDEEEEEEEQQQAQPPSPPTVRRQKEEEMSEVDREPGDSSEYEMEEEEEEEEEEQQQQQKEEEAGEEESPGISVSDDENVFPVENADEETQYALETINALLEIGAVQKALYAMMRNTIRLNIKHARGAPFYRRNVFGGVLHYARAPAGRYASPAAFHSKLTRALRGEVMRAACRMFLHMDASERERTNMWVEDRGMRRVYLRDAYNVTGEDWGAYSPYLGQPKKPANKAITAYHVLCNCSSRDAPPLVFRLTPKSEKAGSKSARGAAAAAAPAATQRRLVRMLAANNGDDGDGDQPQTGGAQQRTGKRRARAQPKDYEVPPGHMMFVDADMAKRRVSDLERSEVSQLAYPDDELCVVEFVLLVHTAPKPKGRAGVTALVPEEWKMHDENAYKELQVPRLGYRRARPSLITPMVELNNYATSAYAFMNIRRDVLQGFALRNADQRRLYESLLEMQKKLDQSATRTEGEQLSPEEVQELSETMNQRMLEFVQVNLSMRLESYDALKQVNWVTRESYLVKFLPQSADPSQSQEERAAVIAEEPAQAPLERMNVASIDWLKDSFFFNPPAGQSDDKDEKKLRRRVGLAQYVDDELALFQPSQRWKLADIDWYTLLSEDQEDNYHQKVEQGVYAQAGLRVRTFNLRDLLPSLRMQ